MNTASWGARIMAPERETRRVAGRFRLAALSRHRSLASRGSHVALRARSFARRLGFLGLALGGPRLVHGRCGDPFRGILRPSAFLQIRLDVIVLTLAFVGPSALWHWVTSRLALVQAACASDAEPSGVEREEIRDPIDLHVRRGAGLRFRRVMALMNVDRGDPGSETFLGSGEERRLVVDVHVVISRKAPRDLAEEIFLVLVDQDVRARREKQPRTLHLGV